MLIIPQLTHSFTNLLCCTYELKQGDFRTDLIGNEYDIIIASLTLHHLTWEEREKFYKTLYSSLNKGGFFIARDIICQGRPETVSILAA